MYIMSNGFIATFVDVFVQVLHSVQRAAHFHIDVRPIFVEKRTIIRCGQAFGFVRIHANAMVGWIVFSAEI